ncbi:MAG: group III truncated hemoglobin [Thiohalorhabdus sp.]|uniref:group III truncated hemoglobin n=1 Tax=Thiohalorhabdus sp. TaxID=3094134 RepID=UPI002FC27DDC
MVRKLEPLCDKIGFDRVEAVIHDFYRRLRADPELGPVFVAIKAREEHERKIIGYWWLAMGGKMDQPPVVDMIGAHARIGLTEAQLQRWLALFGETLRDHLPEELAAQWEQMAHGVGDKLRGSVVRG